MVAHPQFSICYSNYNIQNYDKNDTFQSSSVERVVKNY